VNERDVLRLRHALEAAELIAEFMAGVERSGFLSNRMLQDAVIRNLEIIGEACVNLSDEVRRGHPELPWAKATAIRNRLVHGYFDVDLGVVWATAVDSVPSFASQIRAILASKR
jgi:uncharacterized protein with HEPN domain